MSYGILRVQKCKSLADLGSRAAHNLRASERAAPHADPDRRKRNVIEIGPASVPEVVAAAEARLASAGRFRKDAVRAVELVLTASPAFFATRSKADQNAWAEASLTWLRNTWGADNIISCVLHLDERSPHIQALVVPIHDGKLRASHWLDGPAKLSALQDSYAEAVEPLKLRRGRRRSRAQHVPLRAFYDLAKRIAAAVQRSRSAARPPQLPRRGAFGRVADADWSRLEADLAKFGEEGLQLRAEAIAGRLIADSEVGAEAAKRVALATERAAKAEHHLAALAEQVAVREAHLAAVNRTIDAGMGKVRELRQHLPELEAYRARLVAELHELERQRGDYDRQG